MLEQSRHFFHAAADVLGLSDRLREILLTPYRGIKVDLVIDNDEGRLRERDNSGLSWRMEPV